MTTLTDYLSWLAGLMVVKNYQVVVAGKPDASLRVDLVAVRAGTLPAGGTGSTARARTAASAAATVNLLKNGTAIGSIGFGAGGIAGTFSLAAAVTVADGDLLSLVFPASPDAALADLTFNLRTTS